MFGFNPKPTNVLLMTLRSDLDLPISYEKQVAFVSRTKSHIF